MNYHDTAVSTRRRSRAYVERLQRAADALVFCFPVWCFGLPAILKGWFDLRADAGRFVRHQRPGPREARADAPRSGSWRVTSYGRPRWMAFVMGDPPRKVVKRYLRVADRRQGADRLPRPTIERGNACGSTSHAGSKA